MISKGKKHYLQDLAFVIAWVDGVRVGAAAYRLGILDALRFYQRREYRKITVYPNAIDEARKLKPTIPEVGYYDIPIHDEIELEKTL